MPLLDKTHLGTNAAFKISVQSELEYIKDDLNAVERHRVELSQARERCKVKMFTDDPVIIRSHTSSWPTDRNISGLASNSYNIKTGITPVNFKYKKNEGKSRVKIPGAQSEEAALSESTSQDMGRSGLAVTRKKRVHAQYRV